MAGFAEFGWNNSASQGPAENLTENPLAFVGHTVTGVVESKCSHGYFVNFTVGNNTLHGIVYYPPGSVNLPPWSDGSIVSAEGHAERIVDVGRAMGRKRGKGKKGALKEGYLGVKVPGKRGRKKKSENLRNPRPKATRTSFNFFFNERRTQLKQERPEMTEVNISKLVGDEWKKMSLEQRQPYVATALADKQRFLEAWRIYQTNVDESEAKDVTPGDKVHPGEDKRMEAPSSGHVEAADTSMGGCGGEGSDLPTRFDIAEIGGLGSTPGEGKEGVQGEAGEGAGRDTLPGSLQEESG